MNKLLAGVLGLLLCATLLLGQGAALGTISGRLAPAPFEADGAGRLRFALDLPPAGSALYLVRPAAAVGLPQSPPTRFTVLATGDWKITAGAPNVLVLDYGDLLVAGRRYHDVNTAKANWTIWQADGLDRPAWDHAVQFQTRVFDRNRFLPSSGFEAAFRFEASTEDALRGLELAVEAPERYRVLVNDHEVSFSAASSWLDPHLRIVPIEKWARTGLNRITVQARPFDVRMELESIYLRGNFSVVPGEKGFRLAAAKPLEIGSWSAQGYPFYGDSVLYRMEVEVPVDSDRMRVELTHWEGSLAEVLLDDAPAALLAWPPYWAEFSVRPGRHAVSVRVVSTARNLFGPFHNRAMPRMRGWIADWDDFPEQQPPGAGYDVIGYGLMAPPKISVGRGGNP